jgi:methylase of polypeptide subunit release factors
MTTEKQQILIELLAQLKSSGYHFVTVTPDSHRRYLEKADNGFEQMSETEILREFFGWNRFLPEDLIPAEILYLLHRADFLERSQRMVKSRLRFSSLDDLLFMHSAFPTIENDSVFFGPDTYRYLRFVKEKIQNAKALVDIGCGSGAGGLCLSAHLGNLRKLALTDVNQTALEMAHVNAQAMKLKIPEECAIFTSDLLKNVPAGYDTIIANPPFIIDEKERAYRHGGALFGAQISLDIVGAALDYLPPGGQLALYTGACVVDGENVFLKALMPLLEEKKCLYTFEEIDPDIFGEELSLPAYRNVERLAAVGLYVQFEPRGL